MSARLKLGITLGDINGVGPEVALRAIHASRWPRDVTFILVGAEKALQQQAEALGYPAPSPWQPGEKATQKVYAWDPSPRLRPAWRPGKITTGASKAAAAWIEAAARACMERSLNGMVTAPICKEGFQSAGITVPGHTEYLAQLTGAGSIAMMLLGGPLRVVPLTRHIPLARVAKAVTGKELRETVRLTDEGLRLLGVRRRRIGVCGLNPHAGDGGTIGTEEVRIIGPAVRELAGQGFRVEGPVPADTIFYRALQGHYDAVIAMYHDQGLAPLKMIAFETGVNFTLGLPIIRTSPDHGTAFDIAGKNRANPSSMVEAMRLALKLARKRNPWKQ